VSDRPKVPNLVLRRIRTEERQETRAEFAESMEQKALELEEVISPSERYVARLEDGEIRWPHPPYRRVLAELCGRPITELGFTPPASVIQARRSALPGVPEATLLVVTGADAVTAPETASAHDQFIAVQRWPAWFGLRLARIMSFVDSWAGTNPRIDSLQVLLHGEIAMFDAATPDNWNDERVTHGLARRQALITLAALPLSAVAADQLMATETRNLTATRQLFLSRCAASVTACWHLLRGSDLQTVREVLSGYLLPLEAIASEPSKYQSAAAALASQAHRISGILALHQDQLRIREYHCNRALYYATAAADVGSEASALISLASTYFYMSKPDLAAKTYERAFELETRIPPLQRSRVYAELSVVYGQLGRAHDAIRAAERSDELYPDRPEHDPSFLYAEFTPASLALEQGLAYVALAGHFNARNYEYKAAKIFAQLTIGQLGHVPDRIRFEIVNSQARAAVLVGDLDAFESYFGAGVQGVALLSSKQRKREIEHAWQCAAERWPNERRVRGLKERLQLTACDGVEANTGADD
jgi:tetratricopeptide (TPR) repeat protein